MFLHGHSLVRQRVQFLTRATDYLINNLCLCRTPLRLKMQIGTPSTLNLKVLMPERF